jgi:phytoene dehydrogenase-like protein
MRDPTVLIIGAGLAGLSAGIHAQRNGYQARILEHHAHPGGVAAWWRRGEYLIDGGIHFLMGHRAGSPLYDTYRDVGALPGEGVVDMDVYGRFVHEPTGCAADVTGDLERLARDLKAIAPGDARTVDGLVAGAEAMRGPAMWGVGFGDPPELSGPLDSLKMMWTMRGAARYFVGRHGRPVADYVRDVRNPFLRAFCENLFMPEVPVWFVCMLLGLLADGQLGLLPAGCEGFVMPMERRFRELGGEVTYCATVEKILVDNHRAVGVRLADGTELRAGAVISAADGRSTLYDMLGGRWVDEASARRYRTWKTINPVLTISFGVARTFEGEPSSHMWMLREPFAVGPRLAQAMSVRLFNYSGRFSPPGKTVVQVMFDADWDYWAALREDPARYDAEKERAAAHALEHLEDHYPGIAGQVELIDVATPHTTWRYTRNWRGSIMGWLPSPKAMMSPMRRTLPGLRDFYMAGQWVTPGGGVPTCIVSGHQAVELMRNRGGGRSVREE